MKNEMKVCLLAALIVVSLGAWTPASAGLLWDYQIDIAGQGLAHDDLLSFQETGTASGCVTWSGTGDSYGAPCPGQETGDGLTWNDQQAGKSRTYSLSELVAGGITSAEEIGIVFNPAEPGGDTITLVYLALTFYNTDGTVSETFIWESGPASYCCDNTGTGGAGQLFRLDAETAAIVNAMWFSGSSWESNRIGVSAVITDSAGAMDRFYLTEAIGAAPVPEPASFVTLGSGLLGLAFLLRRYRKRS
ncbi:MAG: PEP-CTERM sorting domain-containing protein [Bryobacteraceae bacterium]